MLKRATVICEDRKGDWWQTSMADSRFKHVFAQSVKAIRPRFSALRALPQADQPSFISPTPFIHATHNPHTRPSPHP